MRARVGKVCALIISGLLVGTLTGAAAEPAVAVDQPAPRAAQTLEFTSKANLMVPATIVPGATWYGTAESFDSQNKPVGSSFGACMIVKVDLTNPSTPRYTNECLVTFTFANFNGKTGIIQTVIPSEVGTFPMSTPIVILGGYGDFRNVRGDGDATLNSLADWKLTFRVEM